MLALDFTLAETLPSITSVNRDDLRAKQRHAIGIRWDMRMRQSALDQPQGEMTASGHVVARRRVLLPMMLLAIATAAVLSGPGIATASGPVQEAKAAGKCSGSLVSRAGIPLDEIAAYGMSCKRARKVLRAVRIKRQPGLPGWKCRSIERVGGGRYSCRKGPARVRFVLAM